jgi:hypothetical protein
MVPVIYSTYGMAMGHRSEALAASGGLQPAGVGRMPGQTARRRGVCVQCWLETMLIFLRLRPQDADIRTAGAHGMRATALPSTQ